MFGKKDFSSCQPNAETRDGAGSINEAWLRKYGLFSAEESSFHINCFKQINWPDPFPEETLPSVECKCCVPESIEDYVYREERMNQARRSPSVQYVPSVFVMLKIMRGCINVTHNDELWLFGGKTHEELTHRGMRCHGHQLKVSQTLQWGVVDCLRKVKAKANEVAVEEE